MREDELGFIITKEPYELKLNYIHDRIVTSHMGPNTKKEYLWLQGDYSDEPLTTDSLARMIEDTPNFLKGLIELSDQIHKVEEKESHEV